MAGVSVDYYVRLEQGRERHPSAQVVDALAHVLQLGDAARLHLFRLAGKTPPPDRGVVTERVDPELLHLMDMWPDTPAIVIGRAYDVLAGNQLGYALFDGFQHGPNLLMKVFLDPDARVFYRDWEYVAESIVSGFRVLYGANPHDPRIQEVLETVLDRSPEFSAMWQRHDVRRKRPEAKRFRHPEAGELTLRVNAFDVKSTPGQELTIYHAEPGSPSADALKLLSTLVATRAQDARQT
jgi:hypothetical protein